MLHLHVWPFMKTLAVVFGVQSVLFAIGENTGNRTLIIISAMSSITTAFVALLGAAVSVVNNRKLNAAQVHLEPLAVLPEKVEELRKNTDGILTKLQASQEQTSEAKQDVAHAAGEQQERTEERERVAGVLDTLSERIKPTQEEVKLGRPQDAPAKIEIVNKKENPVPTVPGQEKDA
jgi:hypothetical protein